MKLKDLYEYVFSTIDDNSTENREKIVIPPENLSLFIFLCNGTATYLLQFRQYASSNCNKIISSDLACHEVLRAEGISLGRFSTLRKNEMLLISTPYIVHPCKLIYREPTENLDETNAPFLFLYKSREIAARPR